MISVPAMPEMIAPVLPPQVLDTLSGVAGTVFGVLLPFIIVLGVVIFVHEYGHYIVGKWGGIHAEVFSIGFGPEIFGWTDQAGTRWRLAWIPLGGYVRFRGDADAASATADADALARMDADERRSSLHGAPLWARASMVAAGPVANFLLTIVVLFFLFVTVGPQSDRPVIGNVAPTGQAAGSGLQAGDRIVSVDGAPVDSLSGFVRTMLDAPAQPRDVVVDRAGETLTLPMSFAESTRIERISPASPAQRACLQPGDVIQAVNGAPIISFSELRDAVLAAEGRPLQLTVERGGSEILQIELTPELLEYENAAAGEIEVRPMIGVQATANIGLIRDHEPLGVLQAAGAAAAAPAEIISRTMGYLASWVAGDVGGASLGGPIGIARMSGEQAEAGVFAFIVFIATISTAIGLINLFPIPVLDGGHLVFYAVEAVRGKPVSESVQTIATAIGLAALLALMLFATSNDLAGTVTQLTAQC